LTIILTASRRQKPGIAEGEQGWKWNLHSQFTYGSFCSCSFVASALLLLTVVVLVVVVVVIVVVVVVVAVVILVVIVLK